MMARTALVFALAVPAMADDFLSEDCLPPQCACNPAGGTTQLHGAQATMTRDADTEIERKLDQAADRRKAKKECFRMAYDEQKRQNWHDYLLKRQGLWERRDNHMAAAAEKEIRARHWAGVTGHETVVRQDKIFDLNKTVKARHLYKDDVVDADRRDADSYDTAVNKARSEYAAKLKELFNSAGTGSQTVTARTVISQELRSIEGDQGDHTASVCVLAGVVTAAAAIIAFGQPQQKRSESDEPKYGTL